MPWLRPVAEDGRMPTPWVTLKSIQTVDLPRSQWIEMDVTHEFLEVGILLADDGLVAVLKQVPDPSMPMIEGDGVPSQKPPHEGWEPARTAPEEEVRMVREQRPGVDGGPGRPADIPESSHESGPVDIVADNRPTFQAADDNMM